MAKQESIQYTPQSSGTTDFVVRGIHGQARGSILLPTELQPFTRVRFADCIGKAELLRGTVSDLRSLAEVKGRLQMLCAELDKGLAVSNFPASSA